jgi:hypothetical protein
MGNCIFTHKNTEYQPFLKNESLHCSECNTKFIELANHINNDELKIDFYCRKCKTYRS